MHIFREIGPMNAYLKRERSNLSTVGLVPTMGALHAGHVSLLQASKRENTITICSIYVNPTQFNDSADLEKYPRTLETDIQMLREAECNVVFCPDNSTMYPAVSQLKFDFGVLDKILEGEFRPGHYSGVALVVSKLFNMVQPDRAYFGQKDFQQFRVISRLVEELKFDLSLVCAPIVREADGLAMSSRNMRLNASERKRAVILYQNLKQTRDRLLQGEPFSQLRKTVASQCDQNNVKLEYLALADRETLTLLDDVADPSRAILLIAAQVGDVRLIDNLYLTENRN